MIDGKYSISQEVKTASSTVVMAVQLSRPSRLVPSCAEKQLTAAEPRIHNRSK
jgi:hypothetical protein